MEIISLATHQIYLPAIIIAAICLLICSISDIRTWLIPDLITLPGSAIIAILQFINSPQSGLIQCSQAVIIFILLWLFARLARKGLGMGDVKLMGLTAIAMPLMPWLLAQILALFFCLIISVAWTAIHWRAAKAESFNTYLLQLRIPLAPYLFAGFGFTCGILWLLR